MQTEQTTKLEQGAAFRVHGFIMLKGLDDGREYRVAYKYRHAQAGEVYAIARRRGRRVVVAHAAYDIDRYIGKGSVSEFNYIEVL